MMTAVFVIMCHLGDNPTEIINRPESWQQCEPVPYRFAFGHSPNILPNLRIVHQLKEVLFKRVSSGLFLYLVLSVMHSFSQKD